MYRSLSPKTQFSCISKPITSRFISSKNTCAISPGRLAVRHTSLLIYGDGVKASKLKMHLMLKTEPAFTLHE